MDYSAYSQWVEQKVNELLHSKIKNDNDYDIEVIREYLIFSQSSNTGEALIDFFKVNNNDDRLCKVVIEILLDESEDDSNDARYSAAKIIPIFNPDLLQKYKKQLLHAQSYKLRSLRPFSDNNIPSWLYGESAVE